MINRHTPESFIKAMDGLGCFNIVKAGGKQGAAFREITVKVNLFGVSLLNIFYIQGHNLSPKQQKGRVVLCDVV